MKSHQIHWSVSWVVCNLNLNDYEGEKLQHRIWSVKQDHHTYEMLDCRLN